ncbi:hypothetical protein DRJ04_04775 [Candidatus Aerophobetes bacterium]|uniref:Putative regulatory protein FmdB zinc ribbon domain-containing protein n=1 Tax=Aerophobetes bacterium TaxID=2030807 RepID=A0A662DGE5_UNCAE|nr:MAG: hypothetical protein DRJ04_04775 [Candidatus Aerophobetes bacterium]
MPLYRYKCEKCGSITQILEGVGKGSNKIRCRSCGSDKLVKLLPASLSVRSSEPIVSECCGMTNPCDNPKRCCQR